MDELNWLVLRLGYSHEVNIPIPEGITVTTSSERAITIFGADKRNVGMFASRVRLVRKPDAYKGKGIRYVGEKVRIKAMAKKR